MTITLEDLLGGSATVDWVATAMTGTTKQVTEWIDLGDKAIDVSWQPAWTDTTGVTGAFGMDISNDTHPTDASKVATPGVLDTDFAVIGPAVSANDDSDMVHASPRARYARLTYTNATNTGVLTDAVKVNGKQG